MGKGSSKGTVQYFDVDPVSGIKRCYQAGCDRPATRWINMGRHANPKWLQTAYRDEHGDWEFADPHHTYTVSMIRN